MQPASPTEKRYKENLRAAVLHKDFDQWVSTFLHEIQTTISRNGRIYVFGNGGSAANAVHIANDFTYAYQDERIRTSIEAICSNQAVITCLANDIGFERVFSFQLEKKLCANDLLIALSGSGNSKNIINALKVGNEFNCRSLGIFGFDGGAAAGLVNKLIHINVDDMQVAEDMQVIIAHAALRTAIS